MRESVNQRGIWLAAAAIGRTVLFRLNTGIGWVTGGGKVRKLPNGDALVPNGRPVTLGFGRADNRPATGAGDLIGWHSIIITPEMVGCRIAVFASIECKTDTSKPPTEDQLNWRQQVIDDGGIAVIAKTAAVAQAALKDFSPKRDGS